MPLPSARERFLDLLRATLGDGSLIKLTLGKPRGGDPTLKNLFVRPVALKSGLHLAFVYRHATRDVTKNFPPAEAFAELEALIGRDFLDAHLFTTTQKAQLETGADGQARVKINRATPEAPLAKPAPATHDRAKTHLIRADAPWLQALGVMNDRGHAREGMADKFRQIQKFAELLTHLLSDAFPETAPPASTSTAVAAAGAPSAAVGEGTPSPSSPPSSSPHSSSPTPTQPPSPASPPLRIVDAGSGKGYLTFAIADLLRRRAEVRGIETRRELVDLCNRVARDNNLAPGLSFTAGTIADTFGGGCDVLIALHACDTATDDALARGIAAGARLLVVSPCCQKELRPQLTAPPVLADALRHGIFQERQAEFVTDALRAQLLEWAGYRTKVFEFISTEHTAKNLMIAAVRTREAPAAQDSAEAQQLRAFAAFYGIRRQRLAELLNVSLTPGT